VKHGPGEETLEHKKMARGKKSSEVIFYCAQLKLLLETWRPKWRCAEGLRTPITSYICWL